MADGGKRRSVLQRGGTAEVPESPCPIAPHSISVLVSHAEVVGGRPVGASCQLAQLGQALIEVQACPNVDQPGVGKYLKG